LWQQTESKETINKDILNNIEGPTL
jgi:hypothetical protein